jgi:hypothetical protein
VKDDTNAANVLGRAVFVHEQLMGHVSGVLVDAGGKRPIGLEVTAAGRPARFLPWVAATLRGRAVVAASAFLLLDSCDPYVEQGALLCRDQRELDALTDADVSRAAVAGMNRS